MKLILMLLAASGIILNLQTCDSIRVLSVYPSISKSHCVLGDALLRGLARKGHQVTSLTTFPSKKPFPNITETKIVNVDPAEFTAQVQSRGGFFKMNAGNVILKTIFMMGSFKKQTEQAITDKSIQDLVKSGAQFDVIIVPIFFTEGIMVYLANAFQAPVIVMSTSGTTTLAGVLVGNPTPPAYVPEVSYAFSDKMSFMERTQNVVANGLSQIMTNLVHLPNEEKVVKKYLPGVKDIYTELKKIALVLSNSHISLSNPQPLVPAMKEIGGFHVEDPKPLPTDLKKILDGAKDGAIFFSLGTNIKSKEIPLQMKKAIMESFAKLKETVIWKWDEETMPGLSKNVHLRSWLPQSDILAHPNIRLFITHGGLLSTIEAVVRGVPVIGIPIFADQKRNILKTVASGFAIEVDHSTMTTESFSRDLKEILQNPKYRENVKRRSIIMNDRLVKPIDEAVYWVEYVARHKGADHYQSALLDLGFVQYLLLDIVAVWGAVVIGAIVLFYLSMKIVVRFVKSKINKKPKSE